MKFVHPRWKTVTTGSEALDFSMTEKAKKKRSILTSRVSSGLDRQLAEMAQAFSRRETSADVLLQKTICHVGPFYTIHHVVSSFTHHTAWEGSYAFVREITVRVTKRSEEKCEKTKLCVIMRFFLLRSKSFGLLRKLKPTQNAFCNEVKQKKKRQTCTHTRHISHTHTNTPFRYLLWSELSHLRKKKKDRSSSRKPENKAATTARHNDTLSCSGADIGTAHGICSRALSVSHVALFIWSRKVEISRVCQMWDRMRDFFLFFSFWRT